MALDVADVTGGAIRVVDPANGHSFTFKLTTGLDGAQGLEPMAPAWAGGSEPPGGTGLAREARQVAEAEARDQGWIEGGDPDVG